MEQEISANGTLAFFLRHGEYHVSTSGTLDAGMVSTLKSGGSENGSDHREALNTAGDEILVTGGEQVSPSIVTGGGWYSIVTTDIGTTTNFVWKFKRAGSD
jgi:hypothetical protein